MTGTVIRMVIKSRRRLVRDAVCGSLANHPEFTVVGQTASIDQLTELCVLRRPDAALIDAVELTVPKVEALRRTRDAVPGTQLVVTYVEMSGQALEVATRLGITQLVPSSLGLEAILHRVRQVARPQGRWRPDGHALTEYDVRVVSLLSTGRSVQDMADVLDISPRTVENHKRRLYAKLGVGTSSHAVSRAAALGVIGPRPVERPPLPPQEGCAPLVVVYGPDSPGVEAVVRALCAAQVPVLRCTRFSELDREHLARQRCGPLAVVLVDPTYDDWLVPALLGARPVVVVSADPGLTTVVDMLLRGAGALVQLADVAADLVTVLSTVAHGYLAVDAQQVADLGGWMALRLADGSSGVPELTNREHDILALVASGQTIRQTAQKLGIAAKTVENAQGHLFRKLGARNRAEAVALAFRLGLLDPDT